MDKFVVRASCANNKTANKAHSHPSNNNDSAITKTNKSKSPGPSNKISSKRNIQNNSTFSDDSATSEVTATEKKGKKPRLLTQCADDSTNKNNPKKKTSVVEKFQDSWLNESIFKNWLVKSKDTLENEVAYCKHCNCQLQNHHSTLERHMKCSKHLKIMQSSSMMKPIPELIRPSRIEEQAKRAEIKWTAFLAKKNLPFNLLDTMIPLISDTLPDSAIAKEMQLSRTKGQALMTQVLGPELKKKMIDDLKEPGSFFSVIIDETTDISVKKQCAMAVIYFDPESNRVETNFFEIYEVDSGTAQNLYFEMMSRLEAYKIPKQNLVGFASDTTNSMVGEHNSVFSHLKAELPGIACVKCSCHSIHLVASKVCRILPSSIEDTLRQIASHFSHSALRQIKLQNLQIFFQQKPHKILSPATTRWLSLKACIDRVLEQREILIEYFSKELETDRSSTTENILKTLKNQVQILYLEFMSYLLDLFNDFNKLFQSEKPLLHELKPQVENLLKIIAANYMEFAYIKRTDIFKLDYKNPGRFLPLDKIYLGVNAQHTLQDIKLRHAPPQCELDDIVKKCLTVYIESFTEIVKRFTFEDPLHECIEILNPEIAQKYFNKDLKNVLDRFPILKKFINEQELVKEWREHAFLNHENLGLNGLSTEEYWQRVFHLKNETGEIRFPNMKQALRLLLVLPFSNACVERIFSQLKIIKTDHRNRLNTDTISALMTTAQEIKTDDGLRLFEPTKKMLTQKLQYKKVLIYEIYESIA